MAAHAGDKIIQARRKSESVYREMDHLIANDRRVLQYAKFENDTTARIEGKLKQKEFEKRRVQYEKELTGRRKQLADLYNAELDQWKREAMSLVETQEDRKARIMQKAYQLRDKRESDRAAIVKAKYDLQWRDACDDARTLDSKAMTLHMNKLRLEQIEEKKKQKGALSAQENDFLEEWNRQLDELERRDREKREYRHRIDMETSADIRRQMEANIRAKEDHFLKNRAEEEAELARLRQEIETDEQLQRDRNRRAYEQGKEVLKFNAESRHVREEEAAIEREQDAILLDYALRKEREANEAEEAKRNANREAARKYKKYLEEQMIKEAEDTAFVDEVRKREEERVWKARDDALKAREDARAYLMQMVDDGRQEQIRYKHDAAQREAAEGKVFAQKFLAEADEAVRQEAAAAAKRHQIEVENQKLLLDQVAYRRQLEDREKQEAYLADKQMQYMERMHQQRLAEQAGSVRGFRPLLKNQWYT